MSKPSRSSITTLLLVSGTIFASCSVDTKGLVFDDDKFDKIENTTAGDGDKTSGGGSSSTSGDGDGTSSGDGDGTSGDGDVTSGGGSSGDGDGTTGEGGSTTGEDPVEPECTMVGELRCDEDGRQVQVCTGEAFINAGDKCEFVCIDGACDGTCIPGDTECVSETESRSCTKVGQWTEPAACANVCVGSSCGGVCQPGERSCDPDDTTGKGKRLCNSMGEWEVGEACTAGECQDGGCTACAGDDTQCTADSKGVQTCNNGTFGDAVECVDKICIDGACTGECRPALGKDEPYRQCVKNENGPSYQIETCGADGKYGNTTACNFVCVEGSTTGQAKCGGVCKPNQTRCEDGVLLQCSDDGMEEKKVEDCKASGEQCLPIDSKGTLGCGVCTEGSEKYPNRRCKQRYVETCISGQWKQAKSACPSGINKGQTGVCWDGKCNYAIDVCGDTRGDGFGCLDSSTPWTCEGSTYRTGECSFTGFSCTYTKCSGVIKF